MSLSASNLDTSNGCTVMPSLSFEPHKRHKVTEQTSRIPVKNLGHFNGKHAFQWSQVYSSTIHGRRNSVSNNYNGPARCLFSQAHTRGLGPRERILAESSFLRVFDVDKLHDGLYDGQTDRRF
jgi:hypothetical protein